LRMIENSGPADRQMIGEVSELISIFPYFQSAYMLLLKGLQNTADVRFENQLKTAALHIASREVLYYFLKKEPVTGIESPSVSLSADNQPENDKTDTQQVVIELAKNSEALITEIEKEATENITTDKSGEFSIQVTAESGYKDSDASIVVINEETGEIEERVTFMDPGFSFPEEDLLELDSEHDKSAVSSLDQALPEPETGKESPSAKQIQSDLIDKFIIANPRIEPVKVKNEIPQIDISKPFVEEKEGFVTETLARIYVKQGYYSRAIDIYEKLSLKFPEKSSYFAALIEKVKELIKK